MIPCLIVTHDAAVRDAIKVGLDQTQAFEMDFAEDAWSIEMARSKAYRVVIADADLPGIDALDLLKKVREVRRDAEFLLIARNRNQTRHLTRDKQQVALYGFVHVPIEPHEFFRGIARLLERMGAATSAA